MAIAGIIFGILVLAGVGILWHFKDQNPIPADIRQSAGFKLYYPTKLPAGYYFDKTSIKSNQGIVYYGLKNSDRQILVTQQKAPQETLELQKMDGFHEIPDLAGQAVAGKLNGASVAILITDSTMVNLTANKVPTETLSLIVQSLSQD